MRFWVKKNCNFSSLQPFCFTGKYVIHKIIYQLMKVLFFILALIVQLTIYAQRVIDVNKTDDKTINGNFNYSVNGVPVSAVKYVRLTEGSPYFMDKWMNGEVYFEDGTGYTSLLLKIDLFENEVRYLASTGEEMIVNTPLKKIFLKDSATGISYSFINSSFIKNKSFVNDKWLQVLVIDSVSLFKMVKKTISEYLPYGSSTYEQKMNATATYIVSTSTKNIEIKKIKELPEALADKKKLIENYIDLHKLSGKSDADFISLIIYYNSVFKP